MAQAASTTYLGEQRRHSARLDQTSPLIIRGIDLLGQPFEERTATQNLSFQGCRYASKHHLPKNTWVTLETPSGDSGKEAVCVRARVAWIQRPRTLRELFQVGVELEKGKNIWNVPFPPGDWTSEASAVLSVVAGGASSNASGGSALSLEDYLQMAVSLVNRGDYAEPEADEANPGDTFVTQLRQEFLDHSQKAITEARAMAEEVVNERTSELRNELKISQANAQAFYEQWLKEFHQGRAEGKDEIASAVSENVVSEIQNLQEQVRNSLAGEWAEKFTHVQVELSKWATDAQALRDEVRATAEATMARSDERLSEKLMEIRHELELLLPPTTEPRAADPNAVQANEFTSSLSEQFEAARKQWDELLQVSLDGAAQRLAERLAGDSQELLRRVERELASRAAELQKEAGIAAEMSHSALEDLKSSFARELSDARDSLKQTEQTAAKYSEYSKEFYSELQKRCEANVTQQSAELEKRAAEIEAQFSKRTDAVIQQRGREAVQRSAEQIESGVAAALERTTKASQDLAASEAHADNFLRIYRERLRQISEQAQQEARVHFDSNMAAFDKDLSEARTEALARWIEQLDAKTVDASQQASATFADQLANRIEQTCAEMTARAQQTLDSAHQKLGDSMESMRSRFDADLAEAGTRELDKTRIALDETASQQLDVAKSEFTKAAEVAASTLGEMISDSATSGLANFSAATDSKLAECRARLESAGEGVLHNVQAHAQTSFEHFQEQLAMKAEQAIQQVGASLERQFESKLEKFHAEGETILEDWAGKQKSVSEKELERHQQEMRAAADSAIESALEHLDQRTDERIRDAMRAADRAMRQACVDVFESTAQKMKEQLQGIAEMRPATPGIEQPEHRASA